MSLAARRHPRRGSIAQSNGGSPSVATSTRGRLDGRQRYVAYGAIGDLISCPRNPNPQFVYALGSIPLADHWAIAATDRIGVRLGYRRNARTDAIPVARWIPPRSATPATALVPQRKVGFPIPNPRLLLGFQGTKRLGEKEYRAPSVTPGVALRPGTQALSCAH
jgi:hypothetical protein